MANAEGKAEAYEAKAIAFSQPTRKK